VQINVVRGTTPQLFNAILFPEASPETKQWIHDQFHRDTSMLTDLGRSFMDSASALYKKLNDPMLNRMARSIVRNLSGITHANSIQPLMTIAAVQGAKPVMQRYIMAMPEIRRLYHKQLCDGYSDSYVDHEPNAVGEAHYDYRRVMNGMVIDLKRDDGTVTWCSVMYPDDLEEGDRELDIDEQSAILLSWDVAKAAIARKIDPTDVFNGKLEL